MRRQIHDTNVNFRAPAFIVARAESAARAHGMSLSELMRAALRSQLDRSQRGEA